jgi:hypothetical protein
LEFAVKIADLRITFRDTYTGGRRAGGVLSRGSPEMGRLSDEEYFETVVEAVEYLDQLDRTQLRPENEEYLEDMEDMLDVQPDSGHDLRSVALQLLENILGLEPTREEDEDGSSLSDVADEEALPEEQHEAPKVIEMVISIPEE